MLVQGPANYSLSPDVAHCLFIYNCELKLLNGYEKNKKNNTLHHVNII